MAQAREQYLVTRDAAYAVTTIVTASARASVVAAIVVMDVAAPTMVRHASGTDVHGYVCL